MLIERITLQGNSVSVMRELAPEVTLRSTPAYPEDSYELRQRVGEEGCYRIRPATDVEGEY